MVKAIVFDCFGVLVNEWLTVLAEQYPEETQKKLWDVVKASNLGYLTPQEGVKRMSEVLAISEDQLQHERFQMEQRNEQLITYIHELRARGYKTAVLSNVSAGGIARRFTAAEMQELFDAIAESGSLGFAKPDENAYSYICGLLEEENRHCVMIDDRDDFCAGAEAAGMQALLYANFSTFKLQLEKILSEKVS